MKSPSLCSNVITYYRLFLPQTCHGLIWLQPRWHLTSIKGFLLNPSALSHQAVCISSPACPVWWESLGKQICLIKP